MYSTRSRLDVIDALRKDGAILLEGVMPTRYLDAAAGEATTLTYQSQPTEVEAKNNRVVRQDIADIRVPPKGALDELATLLQDWLVQFFGDGVFSSPLNFGGRDIQRYPNGTIGIEPHQDSGIFRGVIALYGLSGSGCFRVYESLGGSERVSFEILPNTLLLMRAQGFLPREIPKEDIRPVHSVDTIVGGEDGYRYLLGLRGYCPPGHQFR